MTHDARRRAVEISRDKEAVPAVENIDIRDKPLRFGLLHAPMAWAIENLDTSESERHSIAGHARSLYDIRTSIIMRLNASLEQAYLQEHLQPTLESLEYLQGQRALSRESFHRTAHALMSGGVNTYVGTSEELYTAIESEHGTTIAVHPMHASILNKIARLGPTQQSAFITSYLSKPEEFATLEVARPNGARTLPKDWQERALVSSKYQQASYAISHNDAVNKEIPISAIDDEEVVGCPVTFNYKDVLKLWNFYAQTRHYFTQQQTLAGKTLQLTAEEKIANIMTQLTRARGSH